MAPVMISGSLCAIWLISCAGSEGEAVGGLPPRAGVLGKAIATDDHVILVGYDAQLVGQTVEGVVELVGVGYPRVATGSPLAAWLNTSSTLEGTTLSPLPFLITSSLSLSLDSVISCTAKVRVTGGRGFSFTLI